MTGSSFSDMYSRSAGPKPYSSKKAEYLEFLGVTAKPKPVSPSSYKESLYELDTEYSPDSDSRLTVHHLSPLGSPTSIAGQSEKTYDSPTYTGGELRMDSFLERVLAKELNVRAMRAPRSDRNWGWYGFLCFAAWSKHVRRAHCLREKLEAALSRDKWRLERSVFAAWLWTTAHEIRTRQQSELVSLQQVRRGQWALHTWALRVRLRIYHKGMLKQHLRRLRTDRTRHCLRWWLDQAAGKAALRQLAEVTASNRVRALLAAWQREAVASASWHLLLATSRMRLVRRVAGAWRGRACRAADLRYCLRIFARAASARAARRHLNHWAHLAADLRKTAQVMRELRARHCRGQLWTVYRAWRRRTDQAVRVAGRVERLERQWLGRAWRAWVAGQRARAVGDLLRLQGRVWARTALHRWTAWCSGKWRRERAVTGASRALGRRLLARRLAAWASAARHSLAAAGRVLRFVAKWNRRVLRGRWAQWTRWHKAARRKAANETRAVIWHWRRARRGNGDLSAAAWRAWRAQARATQQQVVAERRADTWHRRRTSHKCVARWKQLVREGESKRTRMRIIGKRMASWRAVVALSSWRRAVDFRAHLKSRLAVCLSRTSHRAFARSLAKWRRWSRSQQLFRTIVARKFCALWKEQWRSSVALEEKGRRVRLKLATRTLKRILARWTARVAAAIQVGERARWLVFRSTAGRGLKAWREFADLRKFYGKSAAAAGRSLTAKKMRRWLIAWALVVLEHSTLASIWGAQLNGQAVVSLRHMWAARLRTVRTAWNSWSEHRWVRQRGRVVMRQVAAVKAAHGVRIAFECWVERRERGRWAARALSRTTKVLARHCTRPFFVQWLRAVQRRRARQAQVGLVYPWLLPLFIAILVLLLPGLR